MYFPIKRGVVRLIASILLFVLVMPLVIVPGISFSDPDALWIELLQLIPFEEPIVKLVCGLFLEFASGSLSIFEYIEEQNISLSQYIFMESAETIFTAVILLLLNAVIGKEFINAQERGTFNKLANCIFQILLAFIATRLTEYIYQFYSFQVLKLSNTAQNFFLNAYSILLSTSSVVLLIISGVLFLNAVFIIALNCLKLLFSYVLVLWGVLCYMYGGNIIGITVGFILWIVVLSVLLHLESLFSPKGG